MAGVGAARQRNDKRKNARRPFDYSARILVDKKGSRRACQIFDISESGARLILDRDHDLPDRFVLLLTVNGDARRQCRVVWRKELNVGVAFTGRGA